jgi:hypothetical protein
MSNDLYCIINLIHKFLKAKYYNLTPSQSLEILDPSAQVIETAQKPLDMSTIAWRFQQKKKAISEQNSAILYPAINEIDRYLDSKAEE